MMTIFLIIYTISVLGMWIVTYQFDAEDYPEHDMIQDFSNILKYILLILSIIPIVNTLLLLTAKASFTITKK